MDFTYSSTRVAAQLEKIRQIQRGYRHAADYGTRSDEYDADVSDDAVSDHQSEEITDDIDDEDTCDHVDTASEGLGCTKCGDVPCDGPDLSGSGHYMSDTESDDESHTSDSASEVSDSDCGDNEMDIIEDRVYSDYLKDIQEEYRTLASIDSQEYEPLRHERREIRLLFIMPREFRLVTGRELVSCFTVVQQLDSAEPFTALSYVWGDDKDTLPIMLNNKVVQVTGNLATALRHIEQDYGRWGVRVFWVDALCINQKDDSEKSHQVQMMGSIYRRAARVFAWLGRATRLTVPVFNWIRKWVDKLTLLYEGNNPGRIFGKDVSSRRWLPDDQSLKMYAEVHRTFTAKIVKPRHMRLLNEFKTLCSNPYWQRVWILQEISSYSPVEIQLGCNSIYLWYVDLFCHIIDAGWGYNEMLTTQLIAVPTSPLQLPPHMLNAENVANLKPLRATGIVYKAGGSLLNMLEGTMTANSFELAPNFRSTKPEDRVFALLSLAGDARDLGLTPDYSKGVKEIYTETASSILRFNGTLEVLSLSQVPKLIEGLPSWAPDWSMVLPAFSLWRPQGLGACLTQTSQIPRVDGDTLTLTGVLVDTVRSTLRNQDVQRGDLLDDAAAARRKQEFIMSAVEFINHHISNPTWCYANKLKTLEVLYHICTPDADFILIMTLGHYGFYEFLWDYEVLVGAQVTRPIPDHILSALSHTLSVHHYERRIFATTRGFIGLGPAYVQEGDVVVILHGGKIPFLLRPVKDGRQGHYELMGEAYMYGMMEGEFMWTNPPTQEFTLV